LRTCNIAGFAPEVNSKCACKSELLEKGESGERGSCVGVPIELIMGLFRALLHCNSEGKNTCETWIKT